MWRKEMTMAYLYWWLTTLLSGRPHFIIGDPKEPYLLRWFLIPRNPWFNLYLHKFCRDDIDRALHDHPWASLSIVLRGGYYEHTDESRRWFGPGSFIFRGATYRHRVELRVPVRPLSSLEEREPAWTLFLTGPKVRVWGFWCGEDGKRFVPWDQFVDRENTGEVGKGCGD
jgi:hypothetical protein